MDFYGRVVKVRTGGAGTCSNVEVDFENQGEIFSHTFWAHTTNPLAYNKLQVGNAVLCRHYPSWDAALQAGHSRPFALIKVYTELEEEMLRRRGAVFPDVPPDLRPNGYYG